VNNPNESWRRAFWMAQLTPPPSATDSCGRTTVKPNRSDSRACWITTPRPRPSIIIAPGSKSHFSQQDGQAQVRSGSCISACKIAWGSSNNTRRHLLIFRLGRKVITPGVSTRVISGRRAPSPRLHGRTCIDTATRCPVRR
jgi:hypothetical protein